MSRKRKKASEIEAVPEVVEDALAEGSGPVQAVAHVGMEEEPEPEAPRASVRTKSRSRKAGHATADAMESPIPAAEADSVADLVAAAEAVAEGAADDSDADVKPAVRDHSGTDAKRTVRRLKVKGATKARADGDANDGDVMVATSDDGNAGDATDGDVMDAPPDSDAMVAASDDGDAINPNRDGDTIVASDATDGRAGRRRRAPKRVRDSVEAGDAVDTMIDEVEVETDGDSDASIASDATDGDATGDGFDGDPMLVRDAIDGDTNDGEAIGGIEVVEGELAAEGAPSDDATATLPTSAAALEAGQLKQLVEALVFASDKPITVVRLRQLTRVADVKRLEDALAELATDYADRGLILQQVSGGFQFRTRTQWSAWVQQLIAGRPVRLTRAQLETLAIIAYRQPITRPEIDDIRGVDSSATLKLLIDRTLIRILGKKEEVGRPMLYGTTKEFLDFFSLGDLRELPTLREYSELTDESRQVITDRLGDLPEGGEGEGGAPPVDGGGGMADGSRGDPGLGAAAEPTAADLIARYVAELDATPTPDASSVDTHLAPVEIAFDLIDAEPADDLEATAVGNGSLADLDPFVLAAAPAIALSASADAPADDTGETGERASTDSEASAEDFAPESTDSEAIAAEAASEFDGDSTNPGIDLESVDPERDDAAPAAIEPESTDSEVAIQLESNESESDQSTEFEPESTDEAAAMQQESLEAPSTGEPDTTGNLETTAHLDNPDPGEIATEAGEQTPVATIEIAAELDPAARLDAAADTNPLEAAQLDAAPISEPDRDADGFASGSGGFSASDEVATDDDLAAGGIASDARVQSDKASVIAAALAAMAEPPPRASTTAEMAAQAGELAVIDGSTDAIVEPGD